MSQRVGLFGGSFDPIHHGHLISARSIAEQLKLDRIILIPSPRPPHKDEKSLTPASHRLQMTRLAVEGDPLFEVSDIELNRAGPSYTFDTVCEFQVRLGSDVRLYWFIGADSLPELPTWSRIDQLVQKVQIVTATRPGWSPPPVDLLAKAVGTAAAQSLIAQCVETPSIDISSTQIRSRVRAGQSISYLTPPGVTSYIHAHGLYK